jgi:N-acetylglucosamine-6-sulfatase
VPLIARGPGVAAGSSSAAMVANIDLGPTILALAGLPPPANADGRSLVPLLTNADQAADGAQAAGDAAAPWRDHLLIEYWSMG